MAVIALSLLLVLCLPATAQRSSGTEETVRVVVGRNGHHPWLNHTNFAYLVDMRFSPVFDKAFMKQVYLLKERVENLKSEGERVTLRNICVKNNYKCIVESLWSYFQDSVANIDRTALDASGFFTTDYLDHLQACFCKPWVEDDETDLHMSCLPKSAFITSPDHTLSNFPRKADWVYRNATQLAITFHLKAPEVGGDSKVTSWLEAVQFYLAHNASVDYPQISAYMEEPYRLTNRP